VEATVNPLKAYNGFSGPFHSNGVFRLIVQSRNGIAPIYIHRLARKEVGNIVGYANGATSCPLERYS